MWHGVGFIAGILVIAIIVTMALRIGNIDFEMGVGPVDDDGRPRHPPVRVHTDQVLRDGEARHWPAWVGLILSIVIVAGAWGNMKAAGESMDEVRATMSSMGGGAKTTPTESTAPSAPAESTPDAPSSDDSPQSP